MVVDDATWCLNGKAGEGSVKKTRLMARAKTLFLHHRLSHPKPDHLHQNQSKGKATFSVRDLQSRSNPSRCELLADSLPRICTVSVRVTLGVA
jgi:hypothetical protein